MARKVKTIKVAKIWGDKQWTVSFGWLNPGRGRPQGVPRLFKVLGEKLPSTGRPKHLVGPRREPLQELPART
jgi:hypothetical protein